MGPQREAVGVSKEASGKGGRMQRGGGADPTGQACPVRLRAPGRL